MNYNEDIQKFISEIDKRIEQILEENRSLNSKLLNLQEENGSLKNNVQSIQTEIKEYISELEDIRRKYVSSNTSD
jgi:chromosome segregation ATPase